MPRKRLVILETPEEKSEKNTGYLRRCFRDSLLRGESPIYFGLYEQLGALDSTDTFERIVAVDAGLAWQWVCDAVVVYTDLGITKWMEHGISAAVQAGKAVEHRKLYPNEAH